MLLKIKSSKQVTTPASSLPFSFLLNTLHIFLMTTQLFHDLIDIRKDGLAFKALWVDFIVLSLCYESGKKRYPLFGTASILIEANS